MIEIVRYIFGYAIVFLEEKDLSIAATRLSGLGVSCEIFPDGRVIIPRLALTRVKEKLSDIQILKIIEGGLPSFLMGLVKRYGIIAAIFIFVILELLSSSVVWDVRIEGELSDIEGQEIREELSCAGLSVGKFWNRLDKDKIESELLIRSDSISWLNINRRGSVAYVSVVKKVHHEDEKKPSGYSNVVASRDAVIMQILVKDGISLVEVGESVREGQILISGVIPTDKGGGYLYADGEVIARFSENITVRIDSLVTEKVYVEEKKRDFQINFFGININIFKKYGNSSKLCDIIEKKEDVCILGVRLPISYTVREISEYELVERKLSVADMTRLAREELSTRLNERLATGELISVKTSASISEDYYEMTASIVLSENIAKNKEFEFIAE